MHPARTYAMATCPITTKYDFHTFTKGFPKIEKIGHTFGHHGMDFRFRCGKSVYTSVNGHPERPRGPPMAHMDGTNIYDPCRVLTNGSERARAKILAFWLLGSRLALCVSMGLKSALRSLYTLGHGRRADV